MSQESKGSPAKAADGFKLPVSGRLNLKFSSLESLVQRLGRHICQDGIFIPTGEPKPAGTLLALRILVQPDETIVEAEGEVLWTRRSHKPQEPTGMAFRFVHLNETGRNFVFRIAQMNREAGIPPAVVVEQTAKEPAAIADKVKQAATGPIIGIDFGTSNSSVAYMDPDRKFLFSLPIQEGTFLRSAVVFRGRIDLPDTTTLSPPRNAASGSLSPSAYARWDGVQPEIPAHLERRGGKGGGEMSGPRSPYCGP